MAIILLGSDIEALNVVFKMYVTYSQQTFFRIDVTHDNILQK